MASVKIKRAVHLPPGPTGKDYPKGVHELPKQALECKFFAKLLKAGLVEVLAAGKPAAKLSHQEHQAKLAEKLLKPKAPVTPAPVDAEAQAKAAEADAKAKAAAEEEAQARAKAKEERAKAVAAAKAAAVKAKADAKAAAAAKAKTKAEAKEAGQTKQAG